MKTVITLKRGVAGSNPVTSVWKGTEWLGSRLLSDCSCKGVAGSSPVPSVIQKYGIIVSGEKMNEFDPLALKLHQLRGKISEKEFEWLAELVEYAIELEDRLVDVENKLGITSDT